VLIDAVLVLAAVAYAIGGYRRGFILGVFSMAGLVTGALLAMRILPLWAQNLDAGLKRSMLVLAAVVVLASAGQYLGWVVGNAVRERNKLKATKVLDQLLGAMAAVLSLTLVVWFLAGALRAVPSPALARAVASSQLLGAVDRVMPEEASTLVDRFRSTVAESNFPRVFSGLNLEPIVPTPPPDANVIPADVLAAAGQSIVKITGDAPACGRSQEGSGSVIAKGRVLTNAHVVAAMDTPMVQVRGEGPQYRAKVVVFDPQRDLAVLAVPDLPAPALRFGTELEPRANAAVAGFPLDGPFTVGAARVRQVLQASGDDIYGRRGAEREVYSLYATVQPGNSGGPLLAADGALAGVVFAKSLDDAQTGYALTLAESEPVISAGLKTNTPVSTGGCAVG
jgi:S1-C subfamily serine protease